MDTYKSEGRILKAERNLKFEQVNGLGMAWTGRGMLGVVFM